MCARTGAVEGGTTVYGDLVADDRGDLWRPVSEYEDGVLVDEFIVRVVW